MNTSTDVHGPERPFSWLGAPAFGSVEEQRARTAAVDAAHRSARKSVRRSRTGFRDGVWHAIGDAHPALGDAHREPTPTENLAGGIGDAGTDARTTLCGLVADVVRKVGVFDPDRRAETCTACVWWEAIRTDTIPAAVARLAEPPRRGLPVALAEAIAAAADRDGDGVDHPATVELLAAVSAHAGEPLIAGDCAEGGCDHPVQHECPVTAVACRACSVRSGGWAGEREGRYAVEATVAVPCSLLRKMAAHYRIGAELFDHAQLADTLTTAGGAS